MILNFGPSDPKTDELCDRLMKHIMLNEEIINAKKDEIFKAIDYLMSLDSTTIPQLLLQDCLVLMSDLLFNMDKLDLPRSKIRDSKSLYYRNHQDHKHCNCGVVIDTAHDYLISLLDHLQEWYDKPKNKQLYETFQHVRKTGG